jgi:hypothetical protein
LQPGVAEYVYHGLVAPPPHETFIVPGTTIALKLNSKAPPEVVVPPEYNERRIAPVSSANPCERPDLFGLGTDTVQETPDAMAFAVMATSPKTKNKLTNKFFFVIFFPSPFFVG